MAKANDKSSTIDWIWLHDALMLAISRLGSVVLAKALLTEWLAAGKLPWSCMAWNPLDVEGIEELMDRARDVGMFPGYIPPECRAGEPEFWRAEHTILWEDNMAHQNSMVGARALGIKVSREHLLALLPEEPRERIEELRQTKTAERKLLAPEARSTPTAASKGASRQSSCAARHIPRLYPEGTDGISSEVIRKKLEKDPVLLAELAAQGGTSPSRGSIDRALGRRK